MIRSDVGWNCLQCGSSIVVESPAKPGTKPEAQSEAKPEVKCARPEDTSPQRV
jgi:hypothetical protein